MRLLWQSEWLLPSRMCRLFAWTRRRFGCGVPESDVAGVDAPELLLLGETALATRAGDAPLFFNLEA